MNVDVWDGIYTRWDDAVRAAEDGGEDVFDSDDWLRKVEAQLQDYRERVDAHGVTLPPRPSNLPIVVALVDPTTIVDLGGSSGWTWDYLRASIPQCRVERYDIIETQKIVDHFKGSAHHLPPVMYHTATKALEECDLLYANSVLQYFPSNEGLLEIVQDLRPKYILLDDLFAGDNPEFYSVQNYYEKKIPCRFMNLSQLDQDLSHARYSLVARVPFDTPTLGVSQTKPMDNFPTSHRLRYSISALYQLAR